MKNQYEVKLIRFHNFSIETIIHDLIKGIEKLITLFLYVTKKEKNKI